MTIDNMMSADEFLMGGGIPSGHAVFDKAPHGTSLTGTLTARPTVEQQRDLDTGKPKFWESDNKPMMQLVVTLQTNLNDPQRPDDTGLRNLYVKGNMLNAIRSAVRATGAKGLDIGGQITVTYVGDGEQKKAGKNPPKLYTAIYQPPSQVAANEFLNGGQQPPAVPQQPAQGFAPHNQGPAPQWAAPAQQAAPAVAQPPAGAPAAGVWTPPPGMSDAQASALQALTPEQRAALGY